MKKITIKAKIDGIKSIVSSASLIEKPKLKTTTISSNDSLSKSIRNKKDAQTFIKELKNTLNK